MAKYNMEIVETLVRVVEVEAEDEDKAWDVVREKWREGEITLNGDDFCDVEFNRAEWADGEEYAIS